MKNFGQQTTPGAWEALGAKDKVVANDTTIPEIPGAALNSNPTQNESNSSFGTISDLFSAQNCTRGGITLIFRRI